VRGENDTVRPDQYDRPPLGRMRLWRQTSQDLRTSDFYVRRRLRTEEDADWIVLRKILAVNSKHLRRMWIWLRQHSSRGCTVGFGRLGCAVRRQIFYHARERSDRFRRDGEGYCLGHILIVEEHRRDVKVVTDLIRPNDRPDARLANVHLPQGAR
jgi:hypothetical protein